MPMQLPDTSSIEFWHKEWPVIKAAPFSFIVSVVLVAILIWFLVWLIHKERMDKDAHTIGHQKREIERLEREKGVTAVAAATPIEASGLDPFAKPQWLTITGKEFINEMVELDGKQFYDCRFINVR